MKRLVFLAVLMLCACGKQVSDRSFIKEQDGVKIVSLYGSWSKMGEEFGRLAKPYLSDVSSFLDGKMVGDSRKEAEISKTASLLFENYPDRLKQFMEASAVSSGIPMEKMKMINALEYAEGCFCSGLAAWGEYTKGGLVYGRNYDAMSYQPLCKDILITVFHPDDGSIPTAIIGYAGELYAVNAFNAKGLMLELNNGTASAGLRMETDMFFSTTSLLTVMMDARSISYLDAFFKTVRSNFGFLIGVADCNEARSYEWCLDGVKRGDRTDTPEGLMAMTNHYVNPEWPFSTPVDESSWSSISRRKNLIALSESSRGTIDPAKMCTIMDTPLEQGGPKHSYTRYQFVFQPSTMTLSLKVTDYHNWVSINLTDYL